MEEGAAILQKGQGGGDEKVGRWNPVGSMSVGQYHHAAVPLGNHGTAWLVAGGCVRDDPMGGENHEKCSSTRDKTNTLYIIALLEKFVRSSYKLPHL